jgi:hypothetical protein
MIERMAKLEEVLANRDAGDQDQVEACLYSLSAYRTTTYQAFENLKMESRLPEAAWNELIDALLIVTAEGAAVRNALRAVFRRWVLIGTIIGVTSETIFGRAISTESLKALLRKRTPGRKAGDFATEIRDFYTKPLSLIRKRWSRRGLGNYLMWSTFSIHSRRPFSGFPMTADGIRRILGLDPRLRNKPLLLMEYHLGNGIEIRFPTIADAYAGDEWSYFFTPAPEKAPHGLIRAWPEYASQTKPRPEVVHKVISGDHLVRRPVRVP